MIPALLLAKLKGVSQETAIKPLIAKGYFAVFPTVGNLLYLTARAIDARHAVEFGTCFGVSAIYLAAAMRDNGGRFVGSDIEPGKVAVARRNLDEAGLSAVSEVREGDPPETGISRCPRRIGQQYDLSPDLQLTNGERQFEPERVAPRHGFELRLTARDGSSLKNSAWNLAVAHRYRLIAP